METKQSKNSSHPEIKKKKKREAMNPQQLSILDQQITDVLIDTRIYICFTIDGTVLFSIVMWHLLWFVANSFIWGDFLLPGAS